MGASALTKSLSVLQPLGVFTFHKNEGNMKIPATSETFTTSYVFCPSSSR